ncbi:monovalent cation:proton antiporter-2 (CPA2) family protein [Aridibaculum aurantiacum]|uniref:monovalent cation:proton antiporter-2 (CPA2) family protein n=1 Tax=Aridibaculum aurantiacum TaxID=2810307 RepID=UPI001A95F383|nr:monovalent cation:proton antiporter-2 (CPA2) family protein [Aridibaculum aurantiacum]
MDQHSFLFQAMIYLAAAVVFVPIARRLGLGSVLGYLFAGIIIGPAVLGFLGDGGADIMHVAEFGVVMMLFIIGLELEPQLLWKLRTSILGLGELQVLVSAAFIGAIAMALGLAWQPALAIGMTLSLSSTAMVLQTMQEKGLMKTVAGQSSFSVLLFQDIAVIPMLAILPFLATGTSGVSSSDHSPTLVSGQPAWAQTLIVVTSVIFVIFLGRYIMRHVFRIIAQTRIRELFTASALLLIVGIAVLMTQVGLSPALGTFLAGVVLANSEYKHALESDIEPFKGLLLGLFFISVGASIDFNLIASQPIMILSIVAAMMVIKALVLALVGKLFKLAFDQNMLFALALSQAGEFAFVLFSFTLQEGILPAALVSTLIAVVAISMALTPLLLLVHERFIQPYIGTKETESSRSADTVNERNPVIIAGFGRFGNVTGRFLQANGIGTTVLDIDSERVDLLRKFGFKVYYGDATRPDLLAAAGANEAKLLIITLSDPAKVLEMVETVKKYFPNLRVLARAYDRGDTYQLMDEGMLHIYRETLDTSLRMGVDAMSLLGHRKYHAQRAARTFLKHDERALKKLAAVRGDQKEYINVAREVIEELETFIQSDRQNAKLQLDEGWDGDSLIAESKSSFQGNDAKL